ncbi:TetR/AcrR family transcriptional regulator [Alkalimonas mucilaginosa]|uniref:TetR/AcrR family transcriptional regulator n=1 Tax=Alkalimonas mucilaginosa TaxID=3057676 RepID=A0ABU7JH52_9GAMM|nr:TetR/AcrR family transcriptional regulator [Alkalimonas sp. MEB004]MEE2024815.1 TetR/AcrR family transcriptional regulator [Alkalimonas sp. MEB004]
MMNKRAKVTKAQIIEAALSVAAEKGAGRVTLDEVAKVSGFSKGGLLYHFPSKEALISAMVQQLVDNTEAGRQQLLAQGENALTAMVKAHALLSEHLQGNTAMALLAAAAEQPGLLNPVQQACQLLLQDINAESGDNPEAVLLMLACDALWFQDMLSISPFTSKQKEQLQHYLLCRAKELMP